MKKQKLAVCVLSAALMIGAATLTSYAAEGWQQSGNSWIYVDNNGNKVTNTWKKGADNLWRYLDSQGNIASNCWVDDEYFVESTGIMATDKWLKLPKRNPAWNETSATTVWYYFSTSGKMVSDGWSKIGGKYYYFDGDGAMQTGWVDDDTYYTNADGVRSAGHIWKIRMIPKRTMMK
jgi:glucan-binding YG repeat protein